MHKLQQKHIKKLVTIIIVILFSASLWQLSTAGWIQVKAVLAQHLLNHSWNQTLNDSQNDRTQKGSINKPWPWADTWPVAKLIVPQHHIEQIILAGDSGSSLAFAPGHSLASAKPNASGTIIISAHRDTHFSFLKDIKLNDIIYIQTADKTLPYQVYNFRIVNSTNFILQTDPDESTLVLVTCYPFDAITAGASLRYLVYATQTNDTEQSHSPENSNFLKSIIF